MESNTPFDPVTSQFDPKVDPITADQQAILIVDRLKNVEQFTKASEVIAPDAVVERWNLKGQPIPQAGEGEKLKANLASYLKFKKGRNEDPLSFEPEAIARKRSENREMVAKDIMKLFEADDETFQAMAKESGDFERYKQWSAYLPPGHSLKDTYLKNKAMEMFGFSAREIASGFAEPMFRKIVKAGDHEPTKDAIFQWSSKTRAKYERRRTIADKAVEAANRRFMAMEDSEADFEKELETASPDLSDTERTFIRKVNNDIRDDLEDKHGHIRPIVRKAFNTVALEEGVKGKFEDEPFASSDDAIRELAKLPQKDFGAAIAMMAETARAHGQDVDGVMNKISRSWDRAVFGNGIEMVERGATRKWVGKTTDKLKDADVYVDVYPDRKPTPAQIAQAINPQRTRRDSRRPGGGPQLNLPPPGTVRRKLTEEERAETRKYLKEVERKAAYGSEFANWREAVAKVKTDKWGGYHPENWIYHTIDSIPEMAASFNPLTLSMVFSAQTERNMADLRAQNPNGDWRKMEGGAALAAAAYTAMAKVQANILFKKMPGVQSLIGQFSSKLTAEVATELAQEGMMPITQKLYAAMDESMPDVELFGANGRLTQIIKSAPQIAFAMVPLVAIGVGGRGVLNYLDRRVMARHLANPEMLAQYGMTQWEIDEMSGMTLEEKADYIQGFSNQATFTEDFTSSGASATTVFNFDLDEMDPDAPPMEVTVLANPDGGFTVSRGEQSIQARTALEAAEAARTLDGKPFKVAGMSMPAARPKTGGEVAGSAAQAFAALNAPESMNTEQDQPGAMKFNPWGDPSTWKLETDNVGGFTKGISHPEVSKAVENVLRVLGSRTPIRFGKRMVPRTALGVYYLKARMIRVRRNADMTTISHEVGHAIEDQFLERGKNRRSGIGDDQWVKVRKASPEMARELDTIGNKLYQGQAPKNTTMSEGFAEYIRMLFEGVHDMAVEAPHTHQWFQENVLDDNPKLAAAIADVQAKSKQYAGQGSILRAGANIVRTPSRIQRLQGETFDLMRQLDDKFVDAFYPLKRISDAARKLASGKFTLDDPFETATQLAMAHDSVVKFMVREGMRDFAGNIFGPETSLEAILKPLKGREDSFAIYLWARRTEAIDIDNKLRGKNRETGLSIEDATKIIAELDSPLFQMSAQKVYDWNNGVLDYAAQSSQDYANVVKLIREIDPGNYIPLFREFERFEKNYANRTPTASTGKLIKSLKGSSRRIKNPFESMISQAREIVLRSNQRAVMEQMWKISKAYPELSDIMFVVPPDKVPEAHRTVVQALEAASRMLTDPELRGQLTELTKVIDEEGQGDSLITFWGEAYMPPGNLENPLIPFFIDGKREWVEVNRTAYDALMGMEVYRLPKVFDVLVGAPNRAFKLGTTGYRASFAMITNPTRDLSTLIHNTRSTASVPRIFGVWLHTIAKLFVESLSGGILVNDSWFKLYRGLGLEMTTSLGPDLDHTRAAARRLFQGKVMKVVHPSNILEYVRDVFQYGEAAARITEMKLIARDIGWNPETDPLTPELARKLAVAAKQVTTNFTAAGSEMRWINQVLPFSNAQVQGIRSHVDAFNRNPVRFMLIGAFKAAAAVTLWLQYKEDEEMNILWERMPMDEKYRYSYIPVGKELIRIPRAFEVDGLFMALPMALLDAHHAESPDEAIAWAKQFVNAFEPSLPVSLSVPSELVANKNFFFDRPIVPESELRDYSHPDHKHLQYGPHNTRLAIELGEMFGQSPRKIDHAIKGFFGGAGGDFVALFGRGPDSKGVERDMALSDIPVIGTIWSSAGQNPYNPKPVDELYDRLTWANGEKQVIEKIKGGKESPEQKRARLILRDAAAMLSMLNEVQKLEVSTTEQRRLSKMKADIAEEAVAVFNGKPKINEKFRAWEKEAKALSIKTLKKQAAAED